MQQEVLFPTLWNIILYIGIIIIDVKLWNKAKSRDSMIVRYLSLAIFFTILQLTFIILNNLLEYIFEIIQFVPNPAGFQLRSMIQNGDLGSSMSIIGNIFFLQFYILVFQKEQVKFKLIIKIYTLITIILCVFFLFFLRITDTTSIFYQPFGGLETEIKYLIIVIHSLIVQVPMIGSSLKLWKKLQMQETKTPESNRLLFIAGMSFLLVTVFVLAILDALSAIGWGIYYYLTYAGVALAMICGYSAFAKETKEGNSTT